VKPQGQRALRLGAPWGLGPSERAPGLPKMTQDVGIDVGADVGTCIRPDSLRFLLCQESPGALLTYVWICK